MLAAHLHTKRGVKIDDWNTPDDGGCAKCDTKERELSVVALAERACEVRVKKLLAATGAEAYDPNLVEHARMYPHHFPSEGEEEDEEHGPETDF